MTLNEYQILPITGPVLAEALSLLLPDAAIRTTGITFATMQYLILNYPKPGSWTIAEGELRDEFQVLSMIGTYSIHTGGHRNES